LDSLGITTSTSISFTPRRYYYGAQTHVLDSIKLNGSKTSLARNSEFAVTRTTWPSGVAQSDSFSAKHELYQRQFTDTAINNRLWQGYRFDSLGRVTQNAWKNTSGSGLLVDFFTYDSLGRVSSTLRSATTCPTSDSTYGYSCSPSGVPDLHTYDEAGNALVPSWTYSAQSNRLLSSPYGGYSYDADGNMIGRNRAYTTTRDSLFWSADGLLDSLRSGTVIIRYRYDAIGRLVQKTSNRTSTDSSYFLWDGTQLLAELNGAGTQRVAEYVYYGGTDHPMAMLTGATTTTGTYYFVQDQIGNVIGSVSGSTVPDRYTYDYWGNRSVVSTSGFNRLAWKGLVWEGDSTSMYYMRNRWYDPNIGRFVTEDPIGVQGGVNLYAFAGADHINGIDVSGLGDDFVLVCFNNPAPLPAGPANDTTKAPQARKRDRICVQMSLADLVNFIAGFGDAASFGLAYDLRDRIGGNENVDVSSKAYALGQILGVAAGSALGDELLQLLRSAEGLQAFGVTARFLEYDSGGSGLNFFWGGTRRNRLAFDWHEFKRWGRMNDLPHIDFRTVEGNILKHWPWSW
jgi:RHS repeat-associated protein